MRIIRFAPDVRPEQLESLDRLPEEGYVWLDFVREEEPAWADEVQRIAGRRIYDEHVRDSLNVAHPSFFDSADAYEMVILRGLASTEDALRFESHPTAFFLFADLLVTVRSSGSVSPVLVAGRQLEGVGRTPQRPAGLMLQVLSAMVDRFLALRDPLLERLEQWQDALLDPNDPFDDWLALMGHRNQLRRLERLAETQLDAVEQWSEGTSVEIDESLAVRVTDLKEHIQRVFSGAQHMQAQLESLVQIHFAAVAHRTNEIMRVLTVLAAVFMPLTFLAGIFGMNFDFMPELKLRYAYFVVLGIMIGLGLGLLFWFRRKKWI